jgi:hypothetical protein
MIVTIQGTSTPMLTKRFWVHELDSEGYRRVMVNMEGSGSWYFYGDWNPSLHPTFQDWMNYIFRPNTIQIVKVE